MSTIQTQTRAENFNPLDVVEQILDDYAWPFDRCSDQEMTVQVPGRWCDYSMHFAWSEDASAMHYTCAFDLPVPSERKPAVHELLSLTNEKLWLGHFCMWDDENLPMFRYALPLRGTQGLETGQLEDLVETALLECERFYPAFQWVIWGGRPPHEALMAAMFETVGEA
ncbi:type III secretion system chaperone family protein [Varunaivibrio sulfuroxidans]|uniref:Sensory transduction regulator n=1 Tax=Varunaivibrio sulfuroxidans TaxID=1773489 RepID=A0A4R3J6E2_9PROT|nr:YbjN domain-containing protein [Varunaivibrio sulfuroxidans]TCS60895.1 hypothetical protein EDD55_10955 [Varunaivibrio sulfuroxidans]WES31696.1 YbjN domain-containing protein [Varunaivibrio sulfuroxidans]